jgi:hypothetical protein
VAVLDLAAEVAEVAEERDQRGGGTGSPAAAMVTGANLTLSLF